MTRYVSAGAHRVEVEDTYDAVGAVSFIFMIVITFINIFIKSASLPKQCRGTLIGLVWFGLVWFGLVWFGLVWFECFYYMNLLVLITSSIQDFLFSELFTFLN